MKRSNQFLQTESQRYALIGALFGLLFPVAATLLRIWESDLSLNLGSVITTQLSDRLLWIIDTAPFFLGYFASIAGRRQDISQKLNIDLRQREIELEQARAVLEQRIGDRTAALEKRANQLQAVSKVAHTIAAIQDIDLLLPEITNLVSDRFGFYHAGIFLLDEKKEYAVLRAANSAGGQNMLSRQHKLKLDMNSIVGYVTSRGEPRIALDVGADSVFFNNPDLPETRSEIALPLHIGGQVIGALDIQSTAPNAFTEADINVTAILADQIAIAIENARLFSEAREALSESEQTFSSYVKQEWTGFASQSKNTGYMFDGTRTTVLDKKDKTEKVKTLAKTGRLSLEKETTELTIPIKFRGQTVGILDVKSKRGNRQWTQDEITLLEAAAERAAFALENARLVESSQRRALRERAIGEISTKIGAVSDLEAIMQTAVEELGRKIGSATEVTLELANEENAFSQEDVSVLSILADQAAIAIQNASSAEQAQRALIEAGIATKQLSGDAWKVYTQTIQSRGYRYDGVKSEALKEASESHSDADALYVPVQLRGQTIGRLKLKASAANRKWTEDERAIIEATAERVAIAMEGARLLDEAQKRAARETFLSEIGAKLSTSFQLDSILRDTVEELGQNLQGSTVSFQLINPSAPPTADSPKADGTSARRKKAE